MKKLTDEERKMPKYPKRGKGAPPKLTREVIEAVRNSLLVGNYFETAMACAGFHKDTGYAWLKLGAKQEKGIYKDFSDAVRKAEADSESRDVMVVEIAAHGSPANYDKNGNKIRDEVKRDPRIAMWRLERKHPKRWGRTEKLEHTGKDGEPLTFVDLIKKLEQEKAEREKENLGDE